jgi:hypothetical protein
MMLLKENADMPPVLWGYRKHFTKESGIKVLNLKIGKNFAKGTWMKSHVTQKRKLVWSLESVLKEIG